MLFYSDNPVRDFERWDAAQEEARLKRKYEHEEEVTEDED